MTQEQEGPHAEQGAMILMVGRSYVGNDVTRSTLSDTACACSYENLPQYRSYHVSNTAPVDPDMRTKQGHQTRCGSLSQILTDRNMR